MDGYNPYYVGAYDFALARPLKHLSSPSTTAFVPFQRAPASSPTLFDIISSIQNLSGCLNSSDASLVEEKIINDIGCWIESVEVRPGGKLIEHNRINYGAVGDLHRNRASNGLSTPATSSESADRTPSEGSVKGDNEGTFLCAKMHVTPPCPTMQLCNSSVIAAESNSTSNLFDDDRADLHLLQVLIRSPPSFKKRLGASRFLLPFQYLSLEFLQSVIIKQFSTVTLISPHDLYFSISFLHFAVLSNRPQLVKFLATECQCSVDISMTLLTSSTFPDSCSDLGLSMCTPLPPSRPRTAFLSASSNLDSQFLHSCSHIGSWTSLMIASLLDYVSVVSVLICNKADATLRDIYGYTALWYAIQGHSLLSVLLLTSNDLTSGINDIDNKGTSFQHLVSIIDNADLSHFASYLQRRNKKWRNEKSQLISCNENNGDASTHRSTEAYPQDTSAACSSDELCRKDSLTLSFSETELRAISPHQRTVDDTMLNDVSALDVFQRAVLSSSYSRLPLVTFQKDAFCSSPYPTSPHSSQEGNKNRSLLQRLPLIIGNRIGLMLRRAPRYLPLMSCFLLVLFTGSVFIDFSRIQNAVALPSAIIRMITILMILLFFIWPLLVWLLLSMYRKPIKVIPGQTDVEELQKRLFDESIVLKLGAREYPFPTASFGCSDTKKAALRCKYRKMFLRDRNDALRSLDASRLCWYCFTFRAHRTHHCKTCGQCIPLLDHHCDWIGGCIGKSQHRAFVIFLFLGCILQDIQLIVTSYLFLFGHFKAIASIPLFSILSSIAHISTISWIHASCSTQIVNISRNITICEEIKSTQDTYFWQERPSATERGIEKIRRWRNPFDRGIWNNCLSFWIFNCRDNLVNLHELKQRDMKEFWDELKTQNESSDINGRDIESIRSHRESIKKEIFSSFIKIGNIFQKIRSIIVNFQRPFFRFCKYYEKLKDKEEFSKLPLTYATH